MPTPPPPPPKPSPLQSLANVWRAERCTEASRSVSNPATCIAPPTAPSAMSDENAALQTTIALELCIETSSRKRLATAPVTCSTISWATEGVDDPLGCNNMANAVAAAARTSGAKSFNNGKHADTNSARPLHNLPKTRTADARSSGELSSRSLEATVAAIRTPDEKSMSQLLIDLDLAIVRRGDGLHVAADTVAARKISMRTLPE
mmetsp:Transcript_166389/g.534476  ORF Transcript_166389/g.534476 Transcript_166389/m.534476 type:complete len:205 (+) Transcript_166389:518-1132(+)